MGIITGIAIENFKGIRERVEIELRPSRNLTERPIVPKLHANDLS